MLLAIVVFGFVLLAIHYVFYGALTLRNKTTKAMEQAVPLQHALTLLRRDLANLVPPGGTFGGQLQTSPTNETPVLGSVGGQPVSPTFHTASAMVDAATPWGEVQKVTYLLAAPTNRTVGWDLYRSVTRNLLPAVDEDPEEQWLLGGVEGLVFQFFDGTQWRETWDSSVEDPALPRAVLVQLQLAEPDRQVSRREPIELVVPLMAQARTNDLAQTSGQSGGGGP